FLIAYFGIDFRYLQLNFFSMKDLNTIAAIKIKAIREQKNIRSNAVAKLMNVSPSVLSRIENGEVQITLNMLQKVSAALECSVQEILQIKDSNYFNNESNTIIQQGTHHTLNVNLSETQFEDLKNMMNKK
ncbi:MAG: helix-turn-helix protein, partial [Bacteroidota bacterium]